MIQGALLVYLEKMTCVLSFIEEIPFQPPIALSKLCSIFYALSWSFLEKSFIVLHFFYHYANHSFYYAHVACV